MVRPIRPIVMLLLKMKCNGYHVTCALILYVSTRILSLTALFQKFAFASVSLKLLFNAAMSVTRRVTTDVLHCLGSVLYMCKH